MTHRPNEAFRNFRAFRWFFWASSTSFCCRSPSSFCRCTHFLQGRRVGQHSPLSGQLVAGVVAAADTEAEELAGGAPDLLPLGLRGALQELVPVLQVPVVAPVLVDAPDGQEVVARETLHERFKLI